MAVVRRQRGRVITLRWGW